MNTFEINSAEYFMLNTFNTANSVKFIFNKGNNFGFDFFSVICSEYLKLNQYFTLTTSVKW